MEGSRRAEDEELGGLKYVIRCSMGQQQRKKAGAKPRAVVSRERDHYKDSLVLDVTRLTMLREPIK